MEGFSPSLDLLPLAQSSDVGVAELDFDGLLPHPLKVEQDGGAAGCGGKLWQAGDLLSRYMIRKPLEGHSKILEIGSGTGLAGLALAIGNPGAKDAKIYITDQANMLPLMQANISLNKLDNRVFAKVLNWGEPLPDYCRDVDLIIAADCVYLESAFPLLKRTLLDLTEHATNTPILFAYKRRRKADRLFFKAMKADFQIDEIEDFPEFETFHRESVFLLSIKRRQNQAGKKDRAHAS